MHEWLLSTIGGMLDSRADVVAVPLDRGDLMDVLSGNSAQVLNCCNSYNSDEMAVAISQKIGQEVVKVTSNRFSNEEMPAFRHVYLLVVESDMVIDLTAGEFVSLESRQSYPEYFLGNRLPAK